MQPRELSMTVPKLFYQSLIIVGLPVLLFIGSNLITLQQNLELERLYEQENHTRLVLSCTAELSELFVTSAATLMHFYATKNDNDIKLLKDKVANITAKNDELESLVKTHQTEKEAYNLIKADIFEATKQLNAIAQDFSSPLTVETALDAYERRRVTEGLVEKTSQDTARLLKSLKERQAQELVSDARVREQQRLFNITAMLMSLCLTLALVVYFSKFITTRLRIIMDNTQKVLSEQPLQQPIGGSDEIAILDKQFHSMHSSLQDARQKERELDSLKRRFYAMITHDLRSPLTAIRLSLQSIVLMDGDNLPERVAGTIDKAAVSADRLTRLVNNLLDVEKITEGKLELFCERCRLNEIVGPSIDAVASIAAEAGLTLINHTTDCDIYCDRDRMIQVLVNLLSNAIKFSPDNECVVVTSSESNGWLELQVIDKGRGIPQEQQDRLFEAYSQGDDEFAHKRGGTGLGLTICKLIMEEHDGKIGVSSKVGAGSSFWVRLPKS